MPALVIVGVQWGDEGKGKIVDRLAAGADLIVRFGGGANAGHTLRVGGEKVVTHLLPSGVLHPRIRCVLGAGMVIDPAALVEELERLARHGFDPTGRLVISRRAHVTLPFMVESDRAANRGPRSIGTTGRGIGPTYGAKAARIGVRLGSLAEPSRARDALEAVRESWAGAVPPPSVDELQTGLAPLMARLAPFLGDASGVVLAALRARSRVVFEGAQGTLLDLDHGTYPFVTSSSTVAGGACVGVGVGPRAIDAVLGVTKAYCTRVGHGPFPTELQGAEAERLRESGEEYGATTGRPRRCGWLDLPALRYAAGLNGLTGLALTKLDVLSGRASVPVCFEYRVDGRTTPDFPIDDLERAEPVLREVPGWQGAIGAARALADLPEGARRYVEMVEREVGVPVQLVSTGPGREETIEVAGVY